MLHAYRTGRASDAHYSYPIADTKADFTPPTDNTVNATEAAQFSKPDSVLVAQVQLAVWRLGCQRAMLSLIDHDTQFFVAESTRTSSLDNPAEFDDVGDSLWLEAGVRRRPLHTFGVR